ncbi:MAG: peroxiredoxin, partial [Candidatus Peregrinibacteria bacterium]|nr:peroxiredoxin [Candidatus Peregrinibacteria bacterium]
MTLKIGDTAPDFTLPTLNGESISLSDFKGKQNVILYFYPKDDTPGCTLEACDFRDNLSRLKNSETAVLGVSKDSLASHEKF